MTASQRLTVLTVVGVLAIVALSYWRGQREGERAGKLRENTQRLNAATARVDTTHAATVAAVKKRDIAKARVVITNDSTITVDGAVSALPPDQAIPIVTLLRDDAAVDSAKDAELVALNAKIVVLVDRVAMLEPEWCGPRCWAAIGATAVVVVIALAAWLLSLAH